MFTGVNKYLVAVLGIFIIVILFLLANTADIQNPLPDFLNPSKSSVSPVVSQALGRNPNEKSAGDLFSQNSKANPMNKIAFEDVRAQVVVSGKPIIAEGRFHGKILDVSYPSGGIMFHLQSYLVNWKNKELWIGWDSSVLPKITYYADEKKTKKIAAGDVKEGDEVYIDETNDYSKVYPESIQAIAIIKIP